MGSDWGSQQIVHYHQLFGNKARATPKKKKEHATHTEKKYQWNNNKDKNNMKYWTNCEQKGKHVKWSHKKCATLALLYSTRTSVSVQHCTQHKFKQEHCSVAWNEWREKKNTYILLMEYKMPTYCSHLVHHVHWFSVSMDAGMNLYVLYSVQVYMRCFIVDICFFNTHNKHDKSHC